MSPRPASLTVAAMAALLAFLLLGAAAGQAETGDAETALVEGNRRFRAGDYAGAMLVYEAGYDSGPSPVLAYNLGATAHRLDRLPEAILWYRRAQLSLGGDPWLEDNLELARSALGTPERPRPPEARWVERRGSLLLTGTLLAWSVPLLAASRSPALRRRRWPIALAATLALLSFTAGTLLGRLGPRAAVLLADCPGLPAGTEVWVKGDEQGWRVLGEPEAACPAEAVCLVETTNCR